MNIAERVSKLAAAATAFTASPLEAADREAREFAKAAAPFGGAATGHWGRPRPPRPRPT